MKVNRVFTNASWIIVCKVIQSILAFIIGILTARYLGPSNYGLIHYVSSIVSFVAPIMYLGFNSTLIQEIVSRPEEEGETIGSSIGGSVISSLICIVGVNAFVYIANQGEIDTLLVCLIYSSLLIFQAIDLIQYWFQAKLLSKYSSLVMLGAYIINSAYKAYLLITQKSIFWFAAANSVEYLFISIGLFILYKKLSGERLTFSLLKIKQMIHKSKYFILSNMMITVFTQTDRIMLKLMLGDVSTGYYSAAVSLATVSSFVFAAIIDSLRPIILENTDNGSRFANSMRRTYCIIVYLSICQCIIMTLFASPIVLLTYGIQYQDSIVVLRCVVWYTTFSYIGAVRSVWILAKNYQRYLWIVNLSGAIVNIVLNLILIPLLGIVGAAVASIITQFFTTVAINYIIKPLRPNNKLLMECINPRILTDIIKEVIIR